MAVLRRQFWSRFAAIAKLYWLSPERGAAWTLLVLQVVLLVAQTGFAVLYVSQTGEFTSALAAHDRDRFWRTILEALVTLAIAIPVYALHYYTRDRLGLRWRRWLTQHFLEAWLRGHAYYLLEGRADLDNPDQRIAEDVRSFTVDSLYFLVVGLGALMQLIAFTGVLWSISRELVFVLVGYAVLANGVTSALFARRMIGLNFEQLRREADFRFDLVRVREHAEAIAFQRGEAEEAVQARRYFTRVFENSARMIRTQLDLAFFQYGFSLPALVLPTIVIAERVLAGELEIGRAVQAGGAFTAILAAMTIVIERFQDLSKFAAGVDRLDAFGRLIGVQTAGGRAEDGTDADAAARPGGAPEQTAAPAAAGIQLAHDACLRLERLTVETPAGERVLVRELSVEVSRGRGLMIVGASGVGKTSLLRAIAGLWRAGGGTVARPGAEHLMFLTQQPYMVPGSLRRQLLYPDASREVPDAELHELLARAGLEGVLARFGCLDAHAEWAKVLSIGEQQRLAFTRVLLAEPRFVMLDEATGALDAASERALYLELARTGTTPVSVTHRAALAEFHAQVLELPGGACWRLAPAAGYRLDAATGVRGAALGDST